MKHIKLFTLTIALCLTASHLWAQTIVGTGPIGNSAITWSLTSDSVLTISGKDAMPDNTQPWENLREAIKTVVISDEITVIGWSAFKDCINIDSVRIPSTVTNIGNSAFNNCSSLVRISLPEKLLSIGDAAFAGCGSLSSIEIPDNVTSIGTSVFSSCSSLTSVVIPDKITVINEWAFYECSKLKSVVISKAVTSIERYAFYGCSSLEGIIIPEAVTRIAYDAFNGCRSLTSIVIPKRVDYIGSDVFANCIELKSVVISEGVPYIPDRAFANCSNIDSIRIPASVQNIGSQAFGGCRLSDVYVNWDQPIDISNKDVFSGMTLFVTTLHVPQGTKALYEAAEVWKDFGTILEAGETDGIEAAVALPSLTVRPSADGLRISGLRPGDDIKLYSITGQLIYIGKATATEQLVRLSDRGIVIVASGGRSAKVVN